MIQAFLLALIPAIALGQTADTPPRFEIADVHVSAKTANPFPRSMPVRAGRLEIKTATMVDLIRFAYGFETDKVLGGPNWLEMDRYDVMAKVPAESTPDTQKLMLQNLLADRFKLVVHKDTRPLPAYALVKGKKVLLKEADATGDTGCKVKTDSGPPPPPGPGGEGVTRVFMTLNGAPGSISLGPGMLLQFECRNMSMAAFAEGMRFMMGANAALGNNPVRDETGLEGHYSFDVKWSLQMNGGPVMAGAGDRVSVFDAVEKQLGLKLEQRQVSTPVIIVDSAMEKPTENPPGVSEALPPISVPTEFEVADIKPSDPGGRGGNFQMQPGGRLTSRGMAMRFLVMRAFNSINGTEDIVGLPKWADTERFDITAKAASAAQGTAFQLDMDTLAPLMRSLLVDRFKLAYHKEERPLTAYSLVAGKPKMKKADPNSRTSCKNGNAPPGMPPGTRTLTCQNTTMAQLADRLQNQGPGLNWPILDATGIEGGWDFTVTFSQTFPGVAAAALGPAAGVAIPAQNAGVATASDPTGGYTLNEAIEKQLGLKLEPQKRNLPVIVIDHLEQKPTDN